ncbi:hypothetical protein B0H17DRAFT_1040335, partial [Mycena rosella]
FRAVTPPRAVNTRLRIRGRASEVPERPTTAGGSAVSEVEEDLVVARADALPNPGAVVVEFEDARATDAAVVR